MKFYLGKGYLEGSGEGGRARHRDKEIERQREEIEERGKERGDLDLLALGGGRS